MLPKSLHVYNTITQLWIFLVVYTFRASHGPIANETKCVLLQKIQLNKKVYDYSKCTGKKLSVANI